MTDSNVLWYNAPAKVWTYALPIGNGHIGAMVYGETLNEKISLNHDEIWSGVPGGSRYRNDKDKNEDKSKYFFKARELALNGKYYEAKETLENNFCGNWSQAYLPLGDLHITMTDKKQCSKKNYRRSLDLRNAVSDVEFTYDGISVKREYFVSAVDNALIINIKNNSENGIDFSLSYTSCLKHTTKAENNAFFISGECPHHLRKDIDSDDYNEVYYYDEKEKGICYKGFVKVLDKTAEIIYSDSEISVKSSKDTTIIFSSETNFVSYDVFPGEENSYLERLNRTLENCSVSDYEEMKKKHIEDHQKYYNRVELNLDGKDMSSFPTDERLKKFQSEKDDKNLYVLIFNYGRYLTVAGSRENTQATTLQGIWNDKPLPPWNSNYTININTEMNYWPTLICNMKEFYSPLISLISDLSKAGVQTAKDYYKARGFVSHHNTDIWRMTTPVPGNPSWSFWPMSSGWFCRHLYEYYEYTLDEKFLKETAYPIMKSAAEFYLDILTEDKDGYLIIAPSTSPENQFFDGDEETAVSETTTMSMSIIKELFGNILSASEKLNINDCFTEEIKNAFAKLLPFKIGKEGQLLEWYKEMKETEVKHRHVSHLYALYPSNLINDEKTPELTEACKKTLQMRSDEGTGWSLGWKINFRARLKDGNHALKLLDNQLTYKDELGTIYRGGGTYPNLFDAHPPFQIDGNFGATSGIAEMLLKSEPGKIYLAPAIPDLWKSGSIKGLKAKGDIEVSYSWKDGKPEDIHISELPENTKVFWNGEEIKL